MSPLDGILRQQAGVIDSGQLHDLGLRPEDVRRLVRRRELVRVHRGVFLNHTAEPTWEQRAWAALRACWPAVLTHESSLRAWQKPTAPCRDPIQLAIRADRAVSVRDGVRVRRIAHYEAVALEGLAPPRTRFEAAVIDVAASTSGDMSAIAALADACGSRRTTAQRLLKALGERDRLSRRLFIRSVLEDVATGTNSVLEHAYLVKVERAHGLPTGTRQKRRHGAGGISYSDVEYEEYGLVVELDGLTFHGSTEQRNADLDRDVDTAVAGRATVRIGYAQVLEDPCGTAARVAAILCARGWTGSAQCIGCTHRAA